MKNELWEARNNPEDLRIAELFDADEIQIVQTWNAEPVVIEGVGGKTFQGFVFRFRMQKKDKSEYATPPMFFCDEALDDLKSALINEFEGFGVSE